MVDAPFTAIERKINELVGMVATLKKEKEDLEEKVAELTKERNEIRSRVETILARLESIEL